MDILPRRDGDGLYSIMLRPCTAEVLRHLLDPDVPFVWVVRHEPNLYLEWWTCPLPLSRSGENLPVKVRSVCFDFLMPTGEFLERLPEFDGLSLYQMRRAVPNTLKLEWLDDRNRARILVQNGLFASFFLPHAMECASFATVDRSAIETALANEAVRSLAF